jgi:hypothetical protein
VVVDDTARVVLLQGRWMDGREQQIEVVQHFGVVEFDGKEREMDVIDDDELTITRWDGRDDEVVVDDTARVVLLQGRWMDGREQQIEVVQQFGVVEFDGKEREMDVDVEDDGLFGYYF